MREWIEEELNGQTRLKSVADVWLAEIEAREEQAPQTIEVYRDIENRIVLPAIGELRLNELTVGTIDRFLKPGTGCCQRLIFATP